MRTKHVNAEVTFTVLCCIMCVSSQRCLSQEIELRNEEIHAEYNGSEVFADASADVVER